MLTLREFLTQPGQLPDTEGEPLVAALEAIAAAGIRIADVLGLGAVIDALGAAGSNNLQGEAQQKTDLLAHQVVLDAAAAAGMFAAVVSEEADTLVPLAGRGVAGRYVLLVDPLDGSSNVDCNVTVGTIFSVLPHAGPAEVTMAEVLQPGHRQVAAGYLLYGPSTLFVLTVGRGTHGFTLDRRSGRFVLTHPSLRVAARTSEYAINHANRRFWEAPVKRCVEALQEGRDGPRGRDFNTRWVASMVADVHRILTRGGIYLYPLDERHPQGRLRLLYEAAPAAFLIEQAGGMASTGRARVLDVVADGPHARTALIFGTCEEVDRVVQAHVAHDAGMTADYTSPLFRPVGLFTT